MQPTMIFRARTPLIRFLGKRSTPANLDHSVRPHPQSPGSLPQSFLNRSSGARQSSTNLSKGDIAPKEGQYFDRNELPARFRRLKMTAEEMEAVEMGGAF
ncbi:hypothetical protein BJ508DRAFT_320557 [Ascobolus immersus RN42]|uniref:Ribosomal protein S36, mitochondrial n=1 Tax=Ascobolus immersus RN42 TaxID=1160509 RepID=A0A3N4INR9_ASCIM|nr:hypothetical protein BJ508DRAFT_320557 [Ascobolus immersus RN42]